MKNVQYLATEIFKNKNSLPSIIMHEVFNFHENGKGIHLATRNIHTAHFVTDTIFSSGPTCGN